MSSIGGSANKNELTHNSFLTPSTALTAILEVGNVADDIVPITGGTADEAYQALLDAVAAPSPNNPFNFDPNQSPSSTTNLLNGLKVYQVTSTSGHVLQAEIVNQGSGYSVGDAGAATGGAGAGCQVEVISVQGGAVRGVRIVAHGSGYSDGDVLTISSGGGNATVRVNTVVFFKTLLYTHESHGSASFTSTLSQLKSQRMAYTGGDTTASSNMGWVLVRPRRAARKRTRSRSKASCRAESRASPRGIRSNVPGSNRGNTASNTPRASVGVGHASQDSQPGNSCQSSSGSWEGMLGESYASSW